MTTKQKYETTPKFVQLRANREVDNHVEPAQHRGEVEFYSIYLGEPGSYQWLTDFKSSDEALEAARLMVLAFRCEVDRSQFDEVLATLAPEPKAKIKPRPKGHPHAALMAEYAKDAAETDKPWERWEASVGPNQPWTACVGHPGWAEFYSFRRKPEPPKTITVNGFEVPAPITEPPAESTLVWFAAPTIPDFAAKVRYLLEWDIHKFERGLLHTTKEAAVAHAKAMLGIDPKEGA